MQHNAKFQTINEGEPHNLSDAVNDVIHWSKVFDDMGVAPHTEGIYGTNGNFSYRIKEGSPEFVITRSGSDLGQLTIFDFCEVLGVDLDAWNVRAKCYTAEDGELYVPSSESFIHQMLYDCRPEVHAIGHGDWKIDDALIEQLGYPITSAFRDWGTLDLMYEVKEIAHTGNYLYARGHGFFSLADTVQKAGTQQVKVFEQVQDILGNK